MRRGYLRDSTAGLGPDVRSDRTAATYDLVYQFDYTGDSQNVTIAGQQSAHW